MQLTAKTICIGVLAAAACGFQHASAQEMRISGLLPFEQSVNGEATPVVNGDTLEIPLPDRSLRIMPWPAYLPQEFAPQQVQAQRHPSPAGPSDRLSMRPAEGGQTWLELAIAARTSTSVVGGWTLRHTARGWWLAQGAKLHFLGQDRESARPVLVPAGMARWCVHLLDADVPAKRPGAAPEGEAQAAWAAVRITNRQRCGDAKPGLRPHGKGMEGRPGTAG